MFWLVLYYTSVIVIPEKYPDLVSCQKAAEGWVAPKQFACIPAPMPKLADDYRYEKARVEYCLVKPDGPLAKEICQPKLCKTEVIGPNSRMICE